MIRLRPSDVRRPRFLLGVLRRRARHRIAAALDLSVPVSLGDMRMLVPARDRLTRRLEEEDFEGDERTLLARALRAGDVFVDVGAHAGIYTLAAARSVGPEGHVYAFEPNAATFDLLQRNVADHGFDRVVTSEQSALSDAAGTGELHVPRRQFGPQSSLASLPRLGATDELTVPLATLDEKLRGVNPTFVKIDVEGWEERVVKGGAKILSPAAAPHLIIEFSDLTAENAGSSTASLAATLRGLGYELYRYDGGANRFLSEPPGQAYGTRNLIATKRLDELENRLSPGSNSTPLP